MSRRHVGGSPSSAVRPRNRVASRTTLRRKLGLESLEPRLLLDAGEVFGGRSRMLDEAGISGNPCALVCPDHDVSGRLAAGSPGIHAGGPLRIHRPDQQPNLACNDAQLFAVDAVLTYDPARLSEVEILPGADSAGWSWAANTSEPGTIRLALAASQPAAPQAELLNLAFRVDGELVRPTIGETQTRSRHGSDELKHAPADWKWFDAERVGIPPG